MMTLPQSIRDKFNQGNWVVCKSQHRFSALQIDQAHEQLNKFIKSSGGVNGITASQQKMDNWSLTATDVSRCVIEFEREIGIDVLKDKNVFHYEGDSFQKNTRFSSTRFFMHER